MATTWLRGSKAIAWLSSRPRPRRPHQPRRKGRPAKYGKKIKVAALLKQPGQLQQAPSPVYGEKGVILKFRTADLLWRPVGILVRFVVVLHPLRGAILLMCTDLTLAPLWTSSASMAYDSKSKCLSNRPSASSALMPITSGWRP